MKPRFIPDTTGAYVVELLLPKDSIEVSSTMLPVIAWKMTDDLSVCPSPVSAFGDVSGDESLPANALYFIAWSTETVTALDSFEGDRHFASKEEAIRWATKRLLDERESDRMYEDGGREVESIEEDEGDVVDEDLSAP